MVLDWKSSPNSSFARVKTEENSPNAAGDTKTDVISPQIFSKITRLFILFTQNEVFAIKIKCRSNAEREWGENATDWARVSALDEGAGGFPQDQQGAQLEVNHGDCQARAIGKKIYQFALIILR